MKQYIERINRMIADVRALNARFTEEGQRAERRRKQLLLESLMANQPQHMNHTQLVKPEPEQP